MLELLKSWFPNPWAAGALEQARHDYRNGLITEWKFRGTLARLGYTRYGIDREVDEQSERAAQ